MDYDQIQIFRSHTNRRVCQAWWDARKAPTDYGMIWKVHFHADYVPSTDWTAYSFDEVLAEVCKEHARWKQIVDARFPNMG
jgi:hypothetical protein